MNNLLKPWFISSVILFAAALVFKFAMRGYDYIAYTLVFIMLLILARHFFSHKVWKIIMGVVAVGLIYFCAVEVPIVKNSFSDKDCERKYLIVLGAAVHGDTPSLALTHRLEGALTYLQNYPESTAILSGGQGKGENMSEAECMYEWLIDHDVPAERLIKEDKSTSTKENLINSFEIIRTRGDEPDGNVTLVSSSYHLCRAKSMAARLDVKAAAVAGSPGYPVYMLNCYIREAFGMTHLWVFGD